MLLLLDDDVIASLDPPLSQTDSPFVEGFERWEVISRGEPHGAGQAFVGVIADPKHDQSPTTANGEGLAAYPLAHHLGLRVISLRIAFDGSPLVIDRFALTCNPFEFFPQFCCPFAGVPLSQSDGGMTEQATNHLQGDIVID